MAMAMARSLASISSLTFTPPHLHLHPLFPHLARPSSFTLHHAYMIIDKRLLPKASAAMHTATLEGRSLFLMLVLPQEELCSAIRLR